MMAVSHVTPQTNDVSRQRDLLALWSGLLLPPFAWFLHQQLSYMLVLWACASGRQFALHLVTVAMLLLAGAGSFMAWRSWQRTGRDGPDKAGGMLPRRRFMAVGGLLSSGMFFLVILAQGIPSFLLSACAP
jgi:hypothetical protein